MRVRSGRRRILSIRFLFLEGDLPGGDEVAHLNSDALLRGLDLAVFTRVVSSISSLTASTVRSEMFWKISCVRSSEALLRARARS